jgi:hypothetical protein
VRLHDSDGAFVNGARLFRHVGEKGFQFGSVLGVFLVAPIVWYRGRSTGGTSASSLLRSVGISTLGGMAFATALGASRVASIPKEERADGLQDRAYRLHYNKGQNRTDLFARVGMTLGGAAAMLYVSNAALVVLGGAGIGAAAGIMAHAATANTSAKK